MEENCIHIKFNISELNGYHRLSETCPEIHHAHLIVENSPEKKILLKVFYDASNLLGDKISSWVHSTSNSFSDLGKKIEVVKINKNNTLSEIDFSLSTLEKISNSTKFYEGNEKYFLLEFDAVRKVYNSPHPKEEKLYVSEFYLNEGSRKLIENLYGYIDHSHSWEAINRKNKFYKFGNIRFKIDYHFYSKQNESTSIIHKEPRLSIEHSNLIEEEIFQYANLIFSIMTLYRSEVVDFIFARVHTKNKTTTITKKDYEIITLKFCHIRRLGFRGDVIDLLRKVKPNAILSNASTYQKFTKRYALGSKMKGESKFMILYNLLEQIRNDCIDPTKLKQEYSFNHGKGKTDKLIRGILRSISSLVVPKEKEKFEKNVINHCRTIKYLPMQDQFDGFFKLLNLNLQKRNLDFKKFKGVRNQVFHGHPVDFNSQSSKDTNSELTVLVGIILLKIIGVNT